MPFVVDLKGHSSGILKQIHLLTIGKMLKNVKKIVLENHNIY